MGDQQPEWRQEILKIKSFYLMETVDIQNKILLLNETEDIEGQDSGH